MNQEPRVSVLAERVRAEMRHHPLACVAACIGAGMIAGRLPLFRIVTGAARVTGALARPLLLVVGAARVWDLVAPARGFDGGEDELRATLNDLLALSLSAAASYERIAPHFEGEDRRVVEHLRAVHQDAVRQLRAATSPPEMKARLWDGLEDHLANVGGRLGEAAVYTLMLSREQERARVIESALENRMMGEEAKVLIRRHLLPRAQENLNTLLRCRAHAHDPVAAV